MLTRKAIRTCFAAALSLMAGCRDQSPANASPIAAKDLPAPEERIKAVAKAAAQEGDPCLGTIPSWKDRACKEDTECVAIKGPCEQCWGSVHRTSGASVQNRVRSADKGKQCPPSNLPPAPPMFCNGGTCEPELY